MKGHTQSLLDYQYMLVVALFCAIPVWSQVPAREPSQAASQPAQSAGLDQTDSRDRNLYVGPQPKLRNFPNKFASNFLLDQKDIWSSPFQIDKTSAKWWILTGLGTAGLIGADHPLAQALPARGTALNLGKNASRAGQWYTVVPAAGAFYLSGAAFHDQKLMETGALGLEAVASADLVTTIFKFSARRERPNEGDHGGHFEKGGSSFPSGHSTQAWALAAVIADEYGNHKWVPYASYGYAALVSASRLLAQDHFSSDVFVGGAIGFFIGRYVVRTHEAHRDHLKVRRSKLLSPAMSPSPSPVQR